MRIQGRHNLNGTRTVVKREHKMIRCTDCEKQISEDHAAYCGTCGAPLCEEC
ncbi:MAG: hypothetical protein OEY39_00150 [Candidatus Bathyarchaeota archaeon]|nr:hypothetical protein [Candidatus Bathyarchaeota archaeon]MDH5622873.1 hypothetical protein [Candidatus Bathyarchaeota archaeon]MDH5636137.1 hypothetical protein [Candidatus Bathyarchaeota archaeon]